MAANDQDIYIEQGASFVMTVTLRDEENELIDLTNHVFEGQIRKTSTSDEILAEFAFETLNQSLPEERGILSVSLSAEQTLAFPMKRNSTAEKVLTEFAYDIQSTVVGGMTERWLEGIATVSPAVTRG